MVYFRTPVLVVGLLAFFNLVACGGVDATKVAQPVALAPASGPLRVVLVPRH